LVSYPVADEELLVRLAQQQDEKAFAQLYETYFTRIFRYVNVKIGNPTEAEDIAQQVFVNAYQSIGSFKQKGLPFSAWLFRIAHNQVIDYVRKRAKRATAPLMEEILPDTGPGGNPEQIVEKEASIEELVQATKGLTQAQQEVISLRFASDLSTAEVARIMGKSEGAIKALQHSAVVALRKKLAGDSK
jgi:RNA polymerase sigma-70 factor (ECF subfamily)